MSAKIPPIAERKPVYKALPIGQVRFSSLEKPDTTFSEDRPKFNITLVYTPEEIAPFKSEVEALYEEWKAQVTKEAKGKKVVFNDPPFKPDLDREKNETGLIRVSCSTDAFRLSTDPKSGEKIKNLRPVPLFDRAGTPVTGVRCYGGSTARPSISISFYASPNPKIGCGLTFGLSAVQIIKASSGARSAQGYGFTAVEDEVSDIASGDSEDAAETTYTEGQDL